MNTRTVDPQSTRDEEQPGLVKKLKKLRDDRPASAASRAKESVANFKDFMTAGPQDQQEMLVDAEANLRFRQHTANLSYVVGGLLAGLDATLLGELFGNIPDYVADSFIYSLIVLIAGVFPAASELFRRLPSERKTVAKWRVSKRRADGVKARKLRAARYSQILQRLFHLQRNMYRFRCAMAVGLLILAQGLYVLAQSN